MSLNLKYGINTEKTHKAFGELFETIDFDMHESLSNQNFKESGKRTEVGVLEISNQQFRVNLHDLYRIVETCQTAIEVCYKKYQLGLMRR